MRRPGNHAAVCDEVRRRLETVGEVGRYKDVGAATRMSGVAAWKHVQKLIAEGCLVRYPDGRIDLAERTDLASVPTEALKCELGRRGVTLDALDEPRLFQDQGRPCAANFCQARVRRGKLFCRDHWFQLPPRLRSTIMGAWAARDLQAYSEAVEDARDRLGGFTRVVERVS